MEKENNQEMISKKIIKKGDKVVIIGDSFVGKTSIINCLIMGNLTDTKPTIGSQHYKYNFNNKENREINLDIWDTAGQERFRSVIPMYYKGAKAIIVVFDITNRDSFEGAKKWIEEIEQNNKGTLIFLVANKIDLIAKRTISEENVKEYSEKNKVEYLECSAKENLNIKELFEHVGSKIPNVIDNNNKYENTNINRDLNDINETSNSRGTCC